MRVYDAIGLSSLPVCRKIGRLFALVNSDRLWSRPLAPLVAALAAGIAAPSLGLVLPLVWLSGAAVVLLFGLIILYWRGLPLTWLGCLLFFILGQGLFQSALDPALPAHHVRRLPQNTPISLQGMVASRPLASIGGGLRFELAASSWSAGGNWQPACGTVLVSGLPEPSELRPGDQVVVRLSLRPVEDLANPGSAGRKLALARRQIFVSGKLWQHLQPVTLASMNNLSWLAAWREQAQNYCRRLLETQPQPARSIFLALLLGDQNEISQPLRQAFNRTGTTHVLSVSGLHLVILAAFFAAVFFWLLRRSAWLLLRLNALKVAVFLSTLPIIGYVWLAESSPATDRSAIMILAYMFLVLLDRHRDVYSALTLAALIILVDSPLQLYSVSFQLSFLAVWGLAYISPLLMRPWQNWLQKWEISLSHSTRKSVLAAWGLAFSSFPFVRPWQNWLISRMEVIGWLKKLILWLGEAWSVSLAATLATLPIIIANFHQAPTYGIVVNIVVTPLIGGIAVILVFLSLLLSFLPLPVSSTLLFLGRLVINFSVYLMEKAAALPGVVVSLPAPTLWQTAAYFLILISLLKAPQRVWRWTGVVCRSPDPAGIPGLVRLESVYASRFSDHGPGLSPGIGPGGRLPRRHVHGHRCRPLQLLRQLRQEK